MLLVAAEEVKVTVPPVQRAVVLPAVIVGTLGVVVTDTEVGALNEDVQAPTTALTV
jgi:hypothetical protein